jgi:hypothetical protein
VDTCPCFLDLEASGFGSGSYPISVAWNDHRGTIERLLISPASVPSWTDWDADAEKVHGLDRERLQRNGWSAAYVAGILNQSLDGRIVYTDAPEFDSRWIDRLFAAVDIPRSFTIQHADDLFLPLLQRSHELQWQAVARLDALKGRIRAVVPGHHDAGYDVGYLLQVWRAAQGHPVKMGHGIGPLPETTATGTFVRVKQA